MGDWSGCAISFCTNPTYEFFTANAVEYGLCRGHADEYESDDELSRAEGGEPWLVNQWIARKEDIHGVRTPTDEMREAHAKGQTERLC